MNKYLKIKLRKQNCQARYYYYLVCLTTTTTDQRSKQWFASEISSSFRQKHYSSPLSIGILQQNKNNFILYAQGLHLSHNKA